MHKAGDADFMAHDPPQFDCFLSHNSKDKPAVRELADALRQRGLKPCLDEDELIPGRDWQEALEDIIGILKAAAVLVGKDGIGPWQAPEMRACLQRCVQKGMHVIPVLLPEAPDQPELPIFLTNYTWVDLRSGITQVGLDRLEWGITGQKPNRLNKSIDTKEIVSDLLVAPSRLPISGAILVGRSKELRRLSQTWRNPKRNVLSIVAWGGMGKTALVQHWLGKMAADDYRGAQYVFDWSFYSQGTRDSASVSADVFIDQALRFFGDEDPKQGGPWEKGARLARLAAASKSLLILDGPEPLQDPPGAMGGRLKDPSLVSLIRGLAARNPGLCLITTREALPELAPFASSIAPRIDLDQLSAEAGALLLTKLGVKGRDDELRKASRNFRGHALALTLLGTYLSEVCAGDIRRRGEVHLLQEGRNAAATPAAFCGPMKPG